jgi:16S rRNA (uracil1498-N3)-methyltransferase
MRTLLAPAPLVAGDLELAGDEAHHGRTVLRLRPGDRLRLADGAGRAGEGEVLAVERDALRLRVGRVATIPAGPLAALTIATAVPKGDRFADLVRGLCELGVGRILPLACARGERVPANLERVRRVAAEALKQCRRGHLPQVGPVVDIPGLAGSGDDLIVLDRSGGAPRIGEVRPTTLVIGPEGGLAPEEVAALVAAGARTVRVAGPILRIETAALAAAAVWSATWEHPSP